MAEKARQRGTEYLKAFLPVLAIHGGVEIRGTFNEDNTGHLGMSPGALERITRIWITSN